MMLCMIGLVIAVPPQAQVSEIGSIEIGYPKYNYAGFQQNFSLHFHVFNATSQLSNVTTSCDVHIYDEAGSHVTKQPALYDDPEFELSIDQGNFTTYRIHAYIIYCNSSTESGFVSGEFLVNNYGLELLQEEGLLYIGFLAIITLVVLVGIFGVIYVDHYIAKFVFYWIVHFSVVLLTFSVWQISHGYIMGFIGLAGIFKVLFYVSISAMFPMIIVSIAWIVYLHTMTVEMRAMIEKGESPEDAFRRANKKWF